ncbi:MAG: gliding motility-associated C-terminal domain-containing protein [Bacteroidota bacterium]
MKKNISSTNSKLIQFSSADYWNRHYKSMIVKSLKSCLILCITFFCFQDDVQATHIVGGELKYKTIGPNRYEISLTFRRDCLGGSDEANFDAPAKVFIYNGKGNFQLNSLPGNPNGILFMQFNNNDTLNNIIMSDCGFEGTQVCVHETTYKEEIFLPFNPGDDGYILSYARCCRNATLENVVDPLETGGTWTVHITPEAQMQSNNSPVFKNWPDVYICANEDLNFDHSATDADGDSLVYKLCTPFIGGSSQDPKPDTGGDVKPPYTEVTWKEPYSLNDLFGGSAALQIDSETGLLTGNPSLVGQFLVGICVEEYRDGVKIGEVRRDFQYNVRVCSPSPMAGFDGNDGNCNGPLVQFDNFSEGATAFQWNFDYPGTDSAFISTEENPLFEYPEPGVYDVRLIVTRGTDICSDTLIQQIAALFTGIEVDFTTKIQACADDGGYTIRLIDRSIEPEDGFDIINQEWTITQNGMSQSFVGPIVNLDILNEDFIVELQVESETGCKQTLIDTVAVADFVHEADFVYEFDGCSEFGVATLAFGDVSEVLNPFDDIEGYEWTITSSGGESTFSDSSFVFNVADTDTIIVNLVVNFGGGCFADANKTIILQQVVPQASFDWMAEGCPDDGTVDLIFFNTTTGLDSSVTINEILWTVEVAGETLNGTGDTLMVNIPKDSILSVEMVTNFSNGCQDIIEDTFLPGPYATIEFDIDSLIMCLGDTIFNVAFPNSDFQYTWSTTGGLYFEDVTDQSNPGVIGIENTSYSVTVSDGLCSVADSFDVVVLDDNNLSITGDSITCDGNVFLVADGGIGEGDFEWSLTSDFGNIIFVGDTLQTNFSSQEQTFYVRFTGESCEDPFAEYTVILSNIFDVVFNGDPVRVCLGDTVPLLANPDPTLTYEWSPLDGIHFVDPMDSSSAHVIGISDTEYFVTLSDAFCSLDTSISVVIADDQEFQVLGDSIVCDENVQLIGFGATGIGTYQWSLDSSFTVIIHEGDTLNTTLNGLSETYYVTFTDKTCGDLVLSYDVRMFEFEIFFIEPVEICAGDTLDYTVFNVGEGPLTWLWEEDPHIVAGDSTMMPTIGVGIDEVDEFELIFTAMSPTGCKLTDTVTFQIIENPIVDFTFELQQCGEFTVCFDIIGDFNGFPNWDFGDTTVTTDMSIDSMPCYTYPGAGTYDVLLSNTTSFCPYQDIVKTITINDDININAIEDQILCLDDTVFLTATSDNIGVEFVWCNLAGDTIAIGPDYNQVVTEEFEVVVKAEDPNGCTDMDTIKVGPFVFNVEPDVPDIFCAGEDTEVSIFVNGTQDGFSFNWGPEDCVVSDGDTGNPILLTDEAKTYIVTITYDELGCVITEEFVVDVTSFEVALDALDENGINTDTINKEEEALIFVVEPMEDYSYEWSTGEVNTTGEITVSPEETTTYSVTVTDGMGCTATAMITIFVRQPVCDETDVFLPSAFSPNGDDVNDVLYLRSNFIDAMQILIYNRWGEEVFSSTDQSLGWDGTFNGEPLAPDVYAYTLQVICINQAEYSVRGNVTLLR